MKEVRWFLLGLVVVVALSFFVVAINPMAPTKTLVTGDTSKYLCKGDINLDGKFNASDLAPFVALMGGSKSESELIAWMGDFNEDGKIDSADMKGFKETAEGKKKRVCTSIKTFEKDLKAYKCKAVKDKILCVKN